MPEMQQRASLVSSASTAASDRDPRHPSSLPPWLHPNDDLTTPLSPGNGAYGVSHRDPHPPPPAHYKPGRKWDSLRSASPPLLSAPISEHQERWRPFMYSGPNPLEQERLARVVSQGWLDEHMPYLNQGWIEDDEANTEAQGILGLGKGFSGLMYRGKWLISPERQERTVLLFWRLLLKNPFVPLGFRLTILAFSAAALGVAGTIRAQVLIVNNDPIADNQCATRASTYMAICVGAIAIPYVGYVTWDEYLSKPLGLRSVPAKVLLLLCDLYFIVFSASNLSLAMDALYDHRWACYNETFALVGQGGPLYNVPATCPNNPNICYKQKALSGILLISLLAWCVTFSISVMRVVEKLRPD